ncbi:MAG TPA: helix-turn-helix domain-containing protein [Methanoregulaceae archaeon]|nr:helix-turn-helix domain-containing protein [Methanoregulaceae archaeon]
MYGVIERRRQYLHLMRQITLEKGHFTTTDIQEAAAVPRSTAQDWINRLVSEGCVIIKEKKQGRLPARYVAVSAVPASACRRIFTTVDGDWVEIYHDCMSGACAAFCGYHHRRAGGVLTHVQREGTLLRECARIGRSDIAIGLYPSAAVGVTGVRREGDMVVQEIRCIGGPAYSLSDMMSGAQGVEKVRISKKGSLVEGEVSTRALTHVVIGVDDTDSPAGGATFAIALALLQHISGAAGVIPIGHHVAMLYPALPGKTAGNSCSFIDIAVDPLKVGAVEERAIKFISDEAASPEWGVAFMTGFRIPSELREFGRQARSGIVSRESAVRLAGKYDIALHGGMGVIGALAGVSLWGLDNAVLLDVDADIRETLAKKVLAH